MAMARCDPRPNSTTAAAAAAAAADAGSRSIPKACSSLPHPPRFLGAAAERADVVHDPEVRHGSP